MTDIITLVFTVVIFTIAISIVLIALSPLDFMGFIHQYISVIVIVIALMAALLIIITIFVYIPDVITK